MERPSPRVGFGLRGRTQMIWWFRIDELRFAVTIEAHNISIVKGYSFNNKRK